MTNRKHFKKILMLLCLTLFMIFTVSCKAHEDIKSEESNTQEQNKNQEIEETSYYPVTYTTYNYAKEAVEVTVDKAPEQVLAVYQNSIETLLALGLEDKIVAAAGLDHKVKDRYQEAFSRVEYLDDWQPNKETVIMLEADFILSWYSYFSEKRIGDVDYYHDNNIATYMSLNTGCVSPRTLQNEIDDILTLGKIFNVNEKAQEIVDGINTRLEVIAEEAKKEAQRSAIVIEFYGDDIHTYGEKSLGGDMVLQLGAELMSPTGDKIGKEDLIAFNPQTIFVVYYNGGERTDEEAEQGAIQNIMGEPAFASLQAVKNNKIVAIPLGEMYASGIRTIDGLERMADAIYK